MFLKSLELNGFKSFAQKTVLEFPGGITGIVGPNGSGKSNIIDCIRWLLGERDSKNLRGSKIEDLIWNGTPKRPRVAMAQAGLNFNNSSGFFPVDYKEVSVSRKVARDGVSQYYLNKSEVRLKDIVDFMSRSRLGTKGLTIIGQGSSDLFVRVAPEERRVMVEEILGLREYQLKKQDAERKLKNTFFNLEKVRAMTEEVAPRLKLLKRQTSKWSKREALVQELKSLEDDYFSFKIKEIDFSEAEIMPEFTKLEKEIKEKQKELGTLEAEVKKIESQPQGYEEIKKIKEEQGRFLAERSRIEKELGRLEGKLEFLGTSKKEDRIFKNDELLGLVDDLKSDIEKSLKEADFAIFKNSVKGILDKIHAFLNPNRGAGEKKDDFRKLEEARNSLAEKFDSLEKSLKALEEKEAGIRFGMEEFNKQFQKNFEAVETERKKLYILEAKKNEIIFKKERLNIKLEELRGKIMEIGRSFREFGQDGARPFSDEELSQMEKRMFRLRGELASIGEIDAALLKEAEEVEKHYEFLTSQSKDLESASIDLKNLIKELGEKIHSEFSESLKLINEEFNKFFRLMFGGGSAKMRIKKMEARSKGEEKSEEVVEASKEAVKIEEAEEKEQAVGIEIELNIPKKRITGLEMLSGGEKSLVSIAALFSLIAVSPPPFLVLDEVDAALDESNSRRFSDLIKEFSKKTQFVIATHNRATMEAADLLYGITMGDDGASKVCIRKFP
ncbi:MAG: AAA family ATPase [Candidatus Wolfebacteria bacterium]|nr:AAA family ATPase [Candidatus Wolfebacteria bacterium]